MSHQAVEWAFQQDTKRQVAATLVLVALAHHINEDDPAGGCWPSTTRLAGLTKLSRATVFRQIAYLETLGLLVREPTVREDGGRSSNVYQLALPPSGCATGPRRTVRRGQARSETGARPAVRPQEQEEEQEEEQEHPPARDDFAEFWTIYPRRVGKPAAAKAFTAAARRVPVEVILSGACRYADDPNLPPEQFIPHPATWLRADRWDDPAEPARVGRDRPTPSQAAAGWLSTVADLLPTDHPAPRALPGGTA